MRICPFEENEEGESEIKRIFWAGEMQMLFGLVNANIIDIDLAASVAKMSLPEAEEMLQGWREAQKM